MSAGFTPGPWEAERHLDPKDAQAPWVGRLAEQRFTALACGESIEERHANALLIAAAPDLFEALTEASMRCSMSESMRKHITAALAKARGEA